MDKTKLDINHNVHHQVLTSFLTQFVDDLNYHPRELFDLLRDCERKLYFGLLDIYLENENKKLGGK